MQRDWYMVRFPTGEQAHYLTEAEADTQARALAVAVLEKVLVMTPYVFNKQMRDAYNVGKYGPIEVDLVDLLEKEG